MSGQCIVLMAILWSSLWVIGGCQNVSHKYALPQSRSIKESILQGLDAAKGDSILTERGFRKTSENKSGMIVKDTSGDETIKTEIHEKECVRYALNAGGLVVHSISIVVLVIDDLDRVSEEFCWEEHTGP